MKTIHDRPIMVGLVKLCLKFLGKYGGLYMLLIGLTMRPSLLLCWLLIAYQFSLQALHIVEMNCVNDSFVRILVFSKFEYRAFARTVLLSGKATHGKWSYNSNFELFALFKPLGIFCVIFVGLSKK